MEAASEAALGGGGRPPPPPLVTLSENKTKPQSKRSTPVKTKPVRNLLSSPKRTIKTVDKQKVVRDNSTPTKQQNTSPKTNISTNILKESDQNLAQGASPGKKQRRLIYNPVPHVSATKENMTPLGKMAYDIWKNNNMRDNNKPQEKTPVVTPAKKSPKKPTKPPKISAEELESIIQNIHDKNTSSETSSKTSSTSTILPIETVKQTGFKLVAEVEVPGKPEIFVHEPDNELSPKVFRKFGLDNVRPLYKPNTRSRSIEPQTVKSKTKDKAPTLSRAAVRTSPRKPRSTTTNPKSPKKQKPPAKPKKASAKQASSKRRATSSPIRKLPKKVGKSTINEVLLEETPTPEALAQTMFSLLSQLSRTNTEEHDPKNTADKVNNENNISNDFDIKQEVIAPNKIVSVKQEM